MEHGVSRENFKLLRVEVKPYTLKKEAMGVGEREEVCSSDSPMLRK